MGGSRSNSRSGFRPDERTKRARAAAKRESDLANQEKVRSLTNDFQEIYMKSDPYKKVLLRPESFRKPKPNKKRAPKKPPSGEAGLAPHPRSLIKSTLG